MTRYKPNRPEIILGMVDSGVSRTQEKFIKNGRRFMAGEDGDIYHAETVGDPMGHGSEVARIIRHHAPDVMICNAQVFERCGVTSAAIVATAIDWLVDGGVSMINLSLGLQNDRVILRESCERAISQGVLLVASSPAQGAAVYPSAYPGILRATGDARCDVSDMSFLDNAQADFGGCPRMLNEPGLSDQGLNDQENNKVGGASMGCAHISGQIAAYLQGGGQKASVGDWLVRQAKYVHSERRTV